jgi:hypothetical protein
MDDGTGKEKGIYNDDMLSKSPGLELDNGAIRLAQTRSKQKSGSEIFFGNDTIVKPGHADNSRLVTMS